MRKLNVRRIAKCDVPRGVRNLFASPAPPWHLSALYRARPNQIYRWQQQMKQAAQGFAEVQAQADPMPVIGPAITVEFDRAIVRIPAGASACAGVGGAAVVKP